MNAPEPLSDRHREDIADIRGRECPNCGSSRTRRGGRVIWSVYLAVIALALPATLLWDLNAAVVAGCLIAVIALAHLLVNQRVCLDCGRQWDSGGRSG